MSSSSCWFPQEHGPTELQAWPLAPLVWTRRQGFFTWSVWSLETSRVVSAVLMIRPYWNPHQSRVSQNPVRQHVNVHQQRRCRTTTIRVADGCWSDPFPYVPCSSYMEPGMVIPPSWDSSIFTGMLAPLLRRMTWDDHPLVMNHVMTMAHMRLLSEHDGKSMEPPRPSAGESLSPSKWTHIMITHVWWQVILFSC